MFQWVPEITHHCQKTPFLLVGTQVDLRDDGATIEKLAKNKQKPISIEQGIYYNLLTNCFIKQVFFENF